MAVPAPSWRSDEADLTLVAGSKGNAKAFAVVSTSMRLLSPVFRRMLQVRGGFSEGQSSTIRLPEDNPNALLILIKLAHAQIASIPQALEASTLCDLALLADKYDVLSKLRPWIQTWFNCVEMKSASEQTRTSVSWIFGMKKEFKESLAKVICQCEVEEGGESLILPESKPGPGSDIAETLLTAGKLHTRMCSPPSICTRDFQGSTRKYENRSSKGSLQPFLHLGTITRTLETSALAAILPATTSPPEPGLAR
ncbi:hypothetical protein MRB53_039026 [Persea americana]|nr:hypothetical protein MRB53_039026 [Persea americana]